MSATPSTSILSQVDGSAQLLLGPIKVLASVTGPIEAKARQELPTLASLEIIVRPATGVSSTREKLLEDKLRSLLQSIIVRHKYPRQLIQVVIQFLSSDSDHSANAKAFTSNELNAAINCVYFALIDANIALFSSFASVSLCILPSSDSFILNPTIAQLNESESHHVICFDIKDKQADKILLVESQGSFSEKQFYLAIDEASKECETIHNKYQRHCIVEKIREDFVWKF
ncbi:exosome complex component Rrp46p [[Candida] railenensis]|uniref:Exosome complex component Rrp46p n=1 Tax=[Candida] railenensis TaxID=45579 RepID=A0A9P0VYR8_9ASCO|nr:exosome complex component Rrp46p [[Candida] railenensis]